MAKKKEANKHYVPMIRRLRPRVWEDVVGQVGAVRSLRNMLKKNTVPQALLLVGDRGLGKTTSARILSARLNCSEANDGDPNPCGECSSCRSIFAGHENFLVQEIDCGTRNKVDEIKELINRSEFGSGGKYRIMILDEFHHVTSHGKTAILKSLEEPNSNVKWILCTTEGHNISETIRSRCTSFRFHLLKDSDMSAYLEETLEGLMKDGDIEFESYDDDAISHICHLAGGSIRQGLSILEQVCAYGGDMLSSAVVQLVSGRSSPEDMNRLITVLKGGNLTRAARLLRDLYNDQFVSGLLDCLFQDFIPRQGSMKSKERRQTMQLLRAIMSYKPVYHNTVNRDALLFTMYDALQEDVGITSARVCQESATDDDPKVVRKELVRDLLGLIKKGGKYETVQKWDDKLMAIGLGSKGTVMAVVRKAKQLPEETKYYLPFNKIKKVLELDKFDPKQLLEEDILKRV